MIETPEPGIKAIAAMPAYNEEKYVGSLVLQAHQYVEEVIVVDDGSTDQTSKIAKLAGATVIRHEQNRGYGAAIQSILAEARRKNPDVLVILDADAQHKPEEIPRLIEPISQGFDFVIGSRKMQKGNIPGYRRFGQNVIGYFTGMVTGRKLSDTESGFRAFSRKAIGTLEIKERGFGVSGETVVEAAAKGLKIAEVPISAIYNKDSSTLNPLVHGSGVLNSILAIISRKRPLLFFGSFGITFVMLGVIAGVIVIARYSESSVLATGTALISMLLITVGMLSIFVGIMLDALNKRVADMLSRGVRNNKNE